MLGDRVYLLECMVFELYQCVYKNKDKLTDDIKSDVLDIANTLKSIWFKLEHEDCNNVIDSFKGDTKIIYRDKLEIIFNDLCNIYKIIG